MRQRVGDNVFDQECSMGRLAGIPPHRLLPAGATVTLLASTSWNVTLDPVAECGLATLLAAPTRADVLPKLPTDFYLRPPAAYSQTGKPLNRNGSAG